jgi:LCP family protein required for cell wall assembly
MQDYNDNSKNRNTRRTATGTTGSRPQGQTRQGTRSQNSTGQAQRRRTTSQGQRQPIRNNQGRRPQRSRRNEAKRKRRKIILFIVEIFLLLIVLMVAAGIWLNNKANQIQYVEFTEDDIDVNDEVQEAIDNGTSALKGFRTVALFGVDSTKGELEKNTRTDTIMIASINLDTNEVRLCSIMRDTWLNMGTDTYNKANAAYAKGGPKQAISMLNMNLDLNITDFVTVGFDALIDAIDAVGGIEIDVKESEIVHLNNYQISIIGHETGTLNAAGEPNYYAEPYVEYIPVEEAGLQTLDGLQATGYCRIRYVGNDYERTSRQRTVLTKLAKKCLTLNPTVLNGIADAVFPEVYTSLTKSEIVSLIAGIASYSVGDNANFPFDGYVQNGRINGASVVVPVDLSKNVSLLHEFLFDEEDYEPTETVKKCSQKIVSDSGMSYSGD